MNINVQEPEIVFELTSTVCAAEGTYTHDKTNITDDSRGYVAGLVRVEFNTARTVCSKQHRAILLASTRVDAAIVIGQQSSQRNHIIAEKCLTSFLKRPK